MSNLRILGILVGLIGLILTFFILRGPNWRRANFIIFSIFNLCLILVSINPNVINIMRDAFALSKAPGGRILALLVISNIFLLFYIFFTKSKVEKITLQFDRLVRSLGSNNIGEKIEINRNIKPVMILMPALNEAENLKELLPRIPNKINGDKVGVLIIDDGSEDETFSLADKKEDIFIVKNPINRGGGAALRLGYDILKKAGAKICITMDADGQHMPEEIEKLVAPIARGHFDFVIGSRILGKREKDNLFRFIGVLVFGKIISFLLGKKITDPSSGFRAFKMSAMAELNLYEDQFHTSELIIEAIKRGLQVKEVPITILKRKYGKSKKGTDWNYGLNFARTIIKTWWR